ncbi:MAG: D-alanine--D-alanine ligase [Candidatus Magasanikbacteria bacterium]|nr:D-alanine--D-alanine ligase [Candidatus Magasanikbacteria bacterium]
MTKLKLALLSGGTSSERDISLISGEAVFGALDKTKYEIFRYDLKTDLENFITDALEKKFSLVLPILHGAVGEDGKLQGMLEILNLKYVFSNTLAHAIAMDKNIAKTIVRSVDIPTPESILITKTDNYNLNKIIEKLGFPIMVKPIDTGSSVGISKANNSVELSTGISKALQYSNDIILEKYITGREFTVPVMGNKNPEALPVIEIIPKLADFYDYRSKYEEGGSEHICPAQIDKALSDKLKTAAIKIFKAMKCSDLARVDFMMDAENNFYFIEINTIPGMTSVSLVPDAARATGLEFSEFLDNLISGALEK